MEYMKFTKYITWGDYHWDWYVNKRKTRYISIVNFIKDWVKEKNVIDIGAGDGLITSVLGIKGIDNEISAINMAAKHGVKIDLGDAYDLPYKDEEFESALMTGTIEHLEHTEKALAEVHRVIQKYFYVNIPYHDKGYEPFHYHKWGNRRFRKQVESCGFKLIGNVHLEFDLYFFKFKKI